MNEDELNKFLEKVMRFQDGCLSEKEISDLETEMDEDSEKRKIFTENMILSQSIHDHMQNESPVSQPTSAKSQLMPFFRSCATLALGVIIGISTMSVAKAVVKDPSLFDSFKDFFESFESKNNPEQKGVPLELETWCGDTSNIVEAEQGITPFDGDYMLRFMKADYPEKPNPGGYVSEMYRWIDMSKIQEQISLGDSEVSFSGMINAVKTELNDQYLFGVTLFAYDAMPPSLLPNTDAFKLEDMCISSASRKMVKIDDNLRTWQTVSVDMTLPSNTKYLLIRLAVSRDKLEKNSPGFVYPGHYLDDVKVTFNKKLNLQVLK